MSSFRLLEVEVVEKTQTFFRTMTKWTFPAVPGVDPLQASRLLLHDCSILFEARISNSV